MRRFPLPLHHGGANHRQILLDERQKEWLRQYYPVTENRIVARAMGVGEETVRSLARAEGLSKSAEGMAAIRRRQQARAARTNHRNGCYDRKRGRPVSEATAAGLRRRWEEEHAGLRENALRRIRREEPERYAAWMATRSAERKELIRKEKLRAVYGLGRKTRLKSVVLCPFTGSQIHHRSNALRRGYLLDADCSEGTEGRYVIYYDDETRRSAAFEENCRRDGFTIRRDE